MNYDPERHHRRSIRLKEYDYAQAGGYFITLCTHDRVCLFGEVANGEMRLNGLGQIVQTAWNDLPEHYAAVQLDAFVVMPNHLHGILFILDDPSGIGAGVAGAGLKPAPAGNRRRHGLPEMVRAFKTFSARRINAIRRTPGTPVWQRNYYEHVIRNEESLQRIRQYVLDNPARWEYDRENPRAVAPEPQNAWLL